MSWTDWLPTFLSWLVPILLGIGYFAGRHWLKAWIDNRVAIQGQRELEAYRAELNAGKGQIAALRDILLSGQANRQAILDQRRIEAVSHIWEAVTELGTCRMLAGMLERIDIEEAGKLAESDASVREFADVLIKSTGSPKDFSNPAKADEPFVSPEAWAYFKAYQSIATMAFVVLSALAHGLDPKKMLKLEDMAELAKKVLPHQSAFVDKYGPSATFLLLDDIKQELLNQLREVLEGKQIGQQQFQQAKEIIERATSLSDTEIEHGLDFEARIPNEIRAKAPK